MNKNQDLFRSYFSSFKQSLFEVSFKVLDNKGQSLQTTILLTLIQFFQLLYFPFQIQVSFAWHNQYLSTQIQKYLQYFTLMRLVIYQDIYIYLIGMYIAVAAVYFIATVIFVGTFLKFLQQWKIIVEILSLVLRFTMTFGFIEITRILLGFLICKKDYQGDYRMLYCPNQICWESTYIIHAVVAIVTLLIFFIIAYISIQLLVDVRKNDTNSISQKEGNSYSFIFVYSTLSLLFYSLLEHPKYTFIQIIIQNTTSLIVFIKIHFNRPFYNQIVQRMWSITSGLVFYTNFMLLTSFCFEHTVMEDTLICWIITAPLLLVILFWNQINEIDILRANMISQLSSNEIIEKCQFLIDLILHHEKDQKKQIYLTGYLEVHKQTCQNPNCAIKVNKTLSKKFKGNPKYQEKKYILKELISQIFQDGIQRFPTSVQMKIHYSYYLFDFLEQGQKALIELEKAENLNPTFGEEFLIFKMKKTIENYFFKSTLDVENINHILNYDRSMKYQFEQLKQSFQELAFNKLIFWNLLLEETPNITLLNKYGTLILNQNQSIKLQLKQRLLNNHFDTQTEQLIKKFSKFVQNIDEYDILYFKKNQQVFINQTDHQFLNDQENLGSYSQPVLLIEIFGKNDQQALIKNLNAAFHSLVGYSKTDLIGKPASNVIQQNYYQLLSVYIESYFSLQLQEKLLEVQERQIFLIHKSKFIINTYVKSSIFATEKGVYQFSRFRLDQIFHQVGYIIFQQDGKIEGLTSSCISLLNINSQQLLLFKQLFIYRFFPYLLQNKDHYFNRLNPIEYDYNKNLFINHSNDYDDQHQDENLKYNLLGQLFEINAKSYSITILDGKQQFFGYFLKIENNELNNMQSIPILKRNKIFNQFKYHLDQKTYIFEYSSQQTSQNESVKCDSDIQEEPKAYIITQQSFPSKKTIFYPKQQLLGNDIRIYRLFQGEIKEVIQEDDDEFSQIEEKSKQQQQLNDDKDIISIHFNSQNDLNYYLQSIKYPIIFKRSTLILSLLLLSLFLIAVFMYIYINESLDEIQVSITLLTLNNQRLASILKIQSNIQDLRGCNLKIEPYTMGTTGGRFVTTNFVEFKTELDILINTNLQILEKSIPISKHRHSDNYDIKQQNVPMYTIDDNYKNYTYSEAMSQLIAKAISLNNTNLTYFIDQNEDLHYYLHNSFNSIPTYQHISQYYYYYYLKDLIQDLNHLLDVFLIISTFNIILIILVIYAIYYYHKQNIKQTISILLYLSKKNINKLISNIQSFIQLLQNIDEEYIESEQDEEILEEKDITDRNKKFKKKKMQFKLQGSNKLLLQFGCYFLLIYTYICDIYFSSNQIISQTNSLVPLINLTSYIPSQYSLIDNSIKEMLYDENSILYNEMNTIDNMMMILKDLEELDAKLHQLNQENAAILSDEYLSLFDSIYIQNPCEIITSNDVTVNITACETFNKNILQEGLSVAITNFFENAQFTLKQYSYYNNTKDYSYLKYNLSSNHRNNYTYNLFNSRIGNANRKMQKVFLRICHIVLVQSLENFVNNYFKNLSFETTLLFLAFCILYLASYFFYIIPLQVRFYLENQKVKEILTLIPIEFYNNDENLQILLRALKDGK